MERNKCAHCKTWLEKREGLLHHDIMITRQNILFILYGAQMKAKSRHFHTKVRNSTKNTLSLVQKDMKTA